MTPAAADAALAAFPVLRGMVPGERALLAEVAQLVAFAPEQVLLRPGDSCGHYLLVTAGSVRVRRLTESGREILLYRIGPGETCVLATAALLGDGTYSAEAVAEGQAGAVAIAATGFKRLVAGSSTFREFVFQAYAQRIADLMQLVEEIVCRRIDVRLAERLLRLRDAQGCVKLTHQALAVELGTAREVVSRVVKEFERRGWVAQRKGTIDVADADSLARLAAGV